MDCFLFAAIVAYGMCLPLPKVSVISHWVLKFLGWNAGSEQLWVPLRLWWAVNKVLTSNMPTASSILSMFVTLTSSLPWEIFKDENKPVRRAWVIVAWVWSIIWYMPLDLIKWAMAYVLNEDGFRDRAHGRTPKTVASETGGALPEDIRASGARLCQVFPALKRVSLGYDSAFEVGCLVVLVCVHGLVHHQAATSVPLLG